MQKIGVFSKIKISLSQLVWLKYLLPVLVLLSMIGFYFYSAINPFSQKNFAEIKETWLIHSQENPDMTFNSHYIKSLPHVKPNEVIIMERTMIQRVDNAELLVKGAYQWLRVSVGDEVLLERLPEDDKKPGLSMNIVRLPKDYVGQTLRIEVSSPYETYSGLPAKVFVGDNSSLIAYMFSVSIPNIVILALCLFVGILILGFCGLQLIRHHKLEKQALILGSFTIVVGLTNVSNDISSYLFFRSDLLSFISSGLYVITPLLIIWYLYFKLEHYQFIYRILLIAIAIFTATVFLLDILNIYDFPDTMDIINTFNVVGTLITALVSVGESYHRNPFFVFTAPWLIMATIMNTFIYIQAVLQTSAQDISLTGLVFLSVVIVICSYTIVNHFRATQHERKQMNFLQLKNGLLTENHELMEHHLVELHQARDEFQQQLSIIQSFSADQEYDKMTDYLNDLTNEYRSLNCRDTLTPHRMTSMILARYQNIGLRKNITCDFAIDLPETLPISDVDLSTLLINLLDNAFEATVKLADPRKRQVSLEIRKEHNCLNLVCKNSYSGDIVINDGTLMTTKEPKEYHGYGLSMMSTIVEAHRGELAIDYNEKKFVVNTTLMLTT